jgi:hypothetical protein
MAILEQSVDVSFKKFSQAVSQRFAELAKGALYVVDIAKDDLWSAYLAAFPPGTDPIFRVRTEHDCSCCRNFVKNLGGVVSIDGARFRTVWDDAAELEGFYGVVASRMRDLVFSKQIEGIFATKESKYGAQRTYETGKDGKPDIAWDHFFGDVPRSHQYLSPDETRGAAASMVGVFKRGLENLNLESLDTVIMLIEQESLYRGPEFLPLLREFRGLHSTYNSLNMAASKEIFLWSNYKNRAAGFKNTVIGTLVEDLSAGEDLDKAVRSFEAKVAPTNYKRPKSLVTPKMIQDANDTVERLGLTDALQRRFAKLQDVSVNDVLFVDNAVRGKMRDGSLVSLLMDQVRPAPIKLDNAQQIPIQEFLDTVVPKALSISALLTGDMLGNFVSLTAPARSTDAKLFRWNNNFAWSYDGNITDSIKQRVKRAGGNVDAALRISLSWFNTDDLDIHIVEPSGNLIYYGCKQDKLDVDMNVCSYVRDAVENVSWTNKNLVDGVYAVVVNNYRKRESIDVGFMIQVAQDDVTRTLQYTKPLANGERVPVCSVSVKNGRVVDVALRSGISETVEFRDKWGLSVGALCPVDSIMLSPNHWEGNQVGNKHYFFMLHGCKNPEPARGLYNEYLSSELEPHRKVLELLGDKLKCPVTDDQLSGLGFSSTLKHELPVSVRTTKGNKAYRIVF